MSDADLETLPSTAAQTDPDYSQRVTPSYLIGVYLAINAIRDLYLLVEGPDCAHMKTQFVQGNHDQMSTLTSVSGYHRIANTALHPDDMTGSREEGLRSSMLQLANHSAVPALAVTSLPMAFITGADYERVCREVASATGKPIVHVPGKSLSGDWLDGYGQTLLAFANQLDLSGGDPSPRRIGIVGNLFDRNEGDNTANVKEIEAIFEALDLDLVSVWLGGGAFSDLLAIRDAGVIISLPYARRAAERVAERIGARVLELPLPFGLPAAEAWIRQLGAELDREQRAEALIDRQLSDVVPKLEWLLEHMFQNASFGYLGDPHLLPGFVELAEVLGAAVEFAVIINNPKHTRELGEHVTRIETLTYPKARSFNRFLADKTGGGNIDLLLSVNSGFGGSDVPILEFGFPSLYRHALYPRPFLGIPGALALVDDMANIIRIHQVLRAQRRRDRR